MALQDNVTLMPKRAHAMVDIKKIEPLFEAAKKHNLSEREVLELVGYSINMTADWRRSGKAPQRAFYAVRGLLAELGDDKKYNYEIGFSFDHNEMARLFAIASGIPIPDPERRALVSKIAQALASET